MRFRDRIDAGERLADRLAEEDLTDPVVLALPRGGVPVAAVVGARLGVPVEVFVAGKVGMPGHQELGVGAVAEGSEEVVVAAETAAAVGLTRHDVMELAVPVRREVQRRARAFRGGRPLPDVAGREVILVDDGLATGVTAEAALRSLREKGPRSLTLAVPVGARDSAARLSRLADEVVCVTAPERFGAVGYWYDDFEQVGDEEVADMLAGGSRRPAGAATATARTESVLIDVPTTAGRLGADLTTVTAGGPLIVFAHGSGSSRHSPRNQAVARSLQDAGFGTLLLDLLTPAEDEGEQRGGRLRFDVARLAARLIAAVDWLDRREGPHVEQLGYFGASTGAAAALIAAAEQGERIGAVVSRGGRPDLAGPALPLVTAPTLLIVGGADPQTLDLNQQAYTDLRCAKQLEVVPGATHLFEEPGTLRQVAALADRWFTRHLIGEDGTP